MEKSSLQNLVTSAYADRLYRPTAVGLVWGGPDRDLVLCVSSVSHPKEWGFVQGGIETGEDPETALKREIREEVSIPANDLSDFRFLDWRDLDAPANRLDKRGFTRGKRYLFYRLAYGGSPVLKIDRRELAGYEWHRRADVAARFAQTRPTRRDLLLEMLALV